MALSSKSKTCFYYQTRVTLRNRGILKRFIENIFKREGFQLKSLNYIFCSDSEILRISKEFLKHDNYTDIITFEFSDKKSPIEGEIYISIDRVKENSKSLGESFKKELHRVIFHGALHLCGYKDKSKQNISEMRAAENYYLHKYSV
jgi:probable rRNA maturation factor